MDQSLEQRVKFLEEKIFTCKSVFNFDEASAFMGVSKSYLYKLTSGNHIPYYKPQGKLIYFEKAELESWLRHNPVKSLQQIEQDALNYSLNIKCNG